jgi:RNA polymerase sigma-70 factor (ECF subfamily)
VVTNLSRHANHLAVLARRWLQDRLADAADADDLVQDVLLAAHQAADSYQGRTEAELQAWLSAMLHNRAINLLQREERFNNLRRDLALASVRIFPSGSEPSETGDLLAGAIKHLPMRDRDLLLFRFCGELGWAELGQRFGITADAARKRGARALSRLQHLLLRCPVGEVPAC